MNETPTGIARKRSNSIIVKVGQSAVDGVPKQSQLVFGMTLALGSQRDFVGSGIGCDVFNGCAEIGQLLLVSEFATDLLLFETQAV